MEKPLFTLAKNFTQHISNVCSYFGLCRFDSSLSFWLSRFFETWRWLCEGVGDNRRHHHLGAMWSDSVVKCIHLVNFWGWRHPQFPTEWDHLAFAAKRQPCFMWCGILCSQTFVIKYTNNRIWIKRMNEWIECHSWELKLPQHQTVFAYCVLPSYAKNNNAAEQPRIIN